jgi:hypothetical protein
LGRATHLEAHGSLGVILAAAARGTLTTESAGETVDALAPSSLYVSAAVVEEAKSALRELARSAR